MFRYLFVLVFCFSTLVKLSATHNRAGEISYVQVDELTIEATIRTFTKTSSEQADQDSVLMDWGDGTQEYIPRVNGDGQDLGNNVKVNLYTKRHTYPGRNTYTMCMISPNRVADIQNVNYPNSVNIVFAIHTTFTFTNLLFDGPNNSVTLLQPPIDVACVGKPYIHIPNGYDVDGDSIAYELYTPYQSCNELVPDYRLPNEIIPQNNNFTMDPATGKIEWVTPQKEGEYNVTFLVKEFRNGILINSMVRDMQIFVSDCTNDPPDIEVIEEICVYAGETVEFDVRISDPNAGDKIKLEATGYPFLLPNKPFFDPITTYTTAPQTRTFRWETTCNDIAEHPYEIVFRGVDNYYRIDDNEYGLADLKSVRIKVIGPPPRNLNSTAQFDKIMLTWENPYDCETTQDSFFQGFSVWRSNNSYSDRDSCNTYLSGYDKISRPIKNISGDEYVYEDNDVEKGQTYCYIVVPEFAQSNRYGNPFNFVKGKRSNEVCTQLLRNIPLITKVSVEQTSVNNGVIHIDWIAPDTLQENILPPYTFVLERLSPTGEYSQLTSSTVMRTKLNKSAIYSFKNVEIDTENTGHTYRVAFYSGEEQTLVDYSSEASSVFLNTIRSSDSKNVLPWDVRTPWSNFMYYVYEVKSQDTVFIDSTQAAYYEHIDLINGLEYCYLIRSEGSYYLDNIPVDAIINYSNIQCGTPLDTVPPCTPSLEVTNICETATEETPEEAFVNTITWNDANIDCTENDVAGYKVYYKTEQNGTIDLLEIISDPEQLTTTHRPNGITSIFYMISSFDSLGNESVLSTAAYIEDCPFYKLPNTFTPNDDQQNDLFIPILNRNVHSVDFRVYNQWGNLVFKTTNPEINWDGRNFSNSKLNDGVYYYTCEVFKSNIDNTITPILDLKGYIQLFGHKK